MAQGTAGKGFLEDFQVKTANYTLQPGERVMADHATPATRLTVTLPTSILKGQIVAVAVGPNTGGFRIAQGVGQSVKLGGLTSLTGTSGYIDSATGEGVLYLLCTVADTTFEAIGGNGLFNMNTSGGVISNVATIGYPLSAAAAANTVPLRGATGRVKSVSGGSGDDTATIADLGGAAMETIPTLTLGPGNPTSLTAVTGSTGTAIQIYAVPGTDIVWLAYDVAGTFYVKVSTDRCATWGTAKVVEAGTPASLEMVAFDANTCYLTYFKSATGCRFAKTTNGGTNWTFTTVNATAVAPTHGTYSISAPSTSVIWVAYTSTSAVIKVALSTDSGANFTTTTSTFTVNSAAGPLGVAATSSSLAYLCYGDIISTNLTLRAYKTTTGINGWASQFNGVAENQYSSLYGTIAIRDATHVFFVLAGYTSSPNGVYPVRTLVTSDGTNWTESGRLFPHGQTTGSLIVSCRPQWIGDSIWFCYLFGGQALVGIVPLNSPSSWSLNSQIIGPGTSALGFSHDGDDDFYIAYQNVSSGTIYVQRSRLMALPVVA